MKKVEIAIVMGSDSDLPVMQEAAQVLEELNIPFELSIISAHRTPKRMYQFARKAPGRGIKVIIAGAGGAAHLPGMIAASTHLPVIGVPVKSSTMSGLDSLYSIVQMPRGVPVASVAINGSKNAGILAAQILSTSDSDVTKKLINYKNNLKNSVIKKAKKLESIGYQAYLEEMDK